MTTQLSRRSRLEAVFTSPSSEPHSRVGEPRRAGHSFRGFTLVELLVAVAIVVAVVATLLPAFASLRRTSRVTADLSNMRLLQAAQLSYATDFNGYLADARLPHGGATQDVEHSFVTTLKPYYDSAFALKSPLDESPHWSLAMGGGNVPIDGTTDLFRVTSYGINDFLSREYSPLGAIAPTLIVDRVSRVKSPGATIHMLHMAQTGVYAGSDHPHVETWGTLGQAPIIAATQVDTAAAGGLEKTGDARANWSFLDGHTATLHFTSTYIDLTTNRFDPTVSGQFDRRVTSAPATN